MRGMTGRVQIMSRAFNSCNCFEAQLLAAETINVCSYPTEKSEIHTEVVVIRFSKSRNGDLRQRPIAPIKRNL